MQDRINLNISKPIHKICRKRAQRRTLTPTFTTAPTPVNVDAISSRALARQRHETILGDPDRLALLLAVLERRARLPMAQHEVFASAVGGVRLTEPGSDLPMCLAIVSALVDRPLPSDVISFGEIGLAGELRQVAHASRRLAEAARLGFNRAIVPANSANGVDGITLIRVATLAEALVAVGLQGAMGK